MARCIVGCLRNPFACVLAQSPFPASPLGSDAEAAQAIAAGIDRAESLEARLQEELGQLLASWAAEDSTDTNLTIARVVTAAEAHASAVRQLHNDLEAQVDARSAALDAAIALQWEHFVVQVASGEVRMSLSRSSARALRHKCGAFSV